MANQIKDWVSILITFVQQKTANFGNIIIIQFITKMVSRILNRPIAFTNQFITHQQIYANETPTTINSSHKTMYGGKEYE